MGVVYKAKDSRLDRLVALKFLPHTLVTDDSVRARFLQEARAASALNHPNVCGIHAIEEYEGQQFIDMEYVDGVTLRHQIDVGRRDSSLLRLDNGISYAIQIGEALREAHSKGVIHRDLKPENIMINSSNQMKVMDFGLARLRGTPRLTSASNRLGTVAYTTPENLQGNESDSRSDIFALGVIVYEMLSGHTPFRGENEAQMIYSILNDTPEPLQKYRSDISLELAQIIDRALEKDPDDRYQTTSDMLIDLRCLVDRSETFSTQSYPAYPASKTPGIYSTLTRMSGQRWTRVGVIAAVMLLIGAWIYLMTQGSRERKNIPAKLTKVTLNPGLDDEPCWSPDGKFLAYTSDESGNLDIIVQPVESGKPIRVLESDADEAQPSWSPDGKMLAFVSARDHGGRLSVVLGQDPLTPFISAKGGDIFLSPALGGVPIKLVEDGYYPAWSPDSKHIVFQSNRAGHWDLWIIPAEGGKPTQLTNDVEFDYQPSWSPDGNWIVYGSGRSPIYNLYVIPSTGGKPRAILKEPSSVVKLKPAFSTDGKYILFSFQMGGSINIWKTLFSSTDDQQYESPARVTTGVGSDINISVLRNRIAFAVVKNIPPDIWELSTSSGKLRQVTSETSSENYPHLSPDGKTLLVNSDRGGKEAIWSMDLNGKPLSEITATDKTIFSPRWSPDGKRIAYHVLLPEQEVRRILIQDFGAVSAREIVDGRFPSWSPDGQKLAFWREAKDIPQIWTYSLEKGEEKQVTSLDSDNEDPTWSPDGKYIAFQAENSSTRHIWIIPSEGGAARQVTFGESEYSHPQWSPIAKDMIMCLKDHKNICLISLRTGAIKQTTNYTEANIRLDYPSWSFDGKTIYFSRAKKVGDIYILENY